MHLISLFGAMLLDEKPLSSNTLQLHTNAAQSKGFTGIIKNDGLW